MPESSLRNRTPESNSDEGATVGAGGGTVKGTTGAAGRVGGVGFVGCSGVSGFDGGFSASRLMIPDAVPAGLFV